MRDSSNADVREAALRVLARGDCSCMDMKQKLSRKGFARADINAVIDSLSDAGLLDDERYAKNYVRSMLERGKGPRWIRGKLTEKGISPDLIQLALEEQDMASRERALCMERALTLCERKGIFDTDDHGHLILPEGGRPAADPDTSLNPFTDKIPASASRQEINKTKEKEKNRLARRLAGAGFSQSVVYSVIRELDQL